MKKWIAILLLVSISLALTACSLDPITGDDFAQIMVNRDLQVVDISADESWAQQVLIAYCDDYKVEFYLLADRAEAETVYTNVKNNAKNQDGNNFTTEVSGNNFSRFSMSRNDEYLLIAFVDSTFVYCLTDEQFKDQIDEHFEALGYK